MASTLSWLAYSDEERRRTLDVIDLFADRDTRDELGLGTIRDGFADAFFPGTSTIQTRARYFLLIPWLYRRIEERHAGSAEITARARRSEINLIEALLKGGDLQGVIGGQARESLKRLPSEVYWQGLRRWGIRAFPGSRDQYHRHVERGLPPARELAPGDDVDAMAGSSWSGWHPNLPDAPQAFPEEASLTLSQGDSDYLTERVLAMCSGTLLAWLVTNAKSAASVAFVWEHPQRGDFPATIAALLRHGELFSEVMHGSALLYNLMLAQRRGSGELEDAYRSQLADWSSALPQVQWDRGEFWEAIDSIAHVDPHTRTFVDAWFKCAFGNDPANLADDAYARETIRSREIVVKRGQARLTNDKALALWGGAAGTAQLDFRWGTAQTMLMDILAGRSDASGA